MNICPCLVTGKLELSQKQLNDDRAAYGNFEAGATYAVANSTFAVQAAQATHDALERSIQVAGFATIAIGGIQLLTEQGCAAAAKYGLQAIVSLAKGTATSIIAGKGVGYLASEFGIDPQYVQIGADSLQLFFLFRAAQQERLKNNSGCFAGDTLIDTTNHGEVPIDQLQDGERVVTSVGETPGQNGPSASTFSSTAVDPATWRQVTLTMSDPNNAGDTYQMQLLEPLTWIEQNDAAAGSWVELDLPELQISGEAQVQTIDPCPAIESGPGQVILGTFEHVSNDVVDVDLVGQSSPLQVTSGHLLWSLTRDGWVEAGGLEAGEQLACADGPVTAASVAAGSESMPVYNLDVENDHRYLVGRDRVLAHNSRSEL